MFLFVMIETVLMFKKDPHKDYLDAKIQWQYAAINQYLCEVIGDIEHTIKMNLSIINHSMKVCL